MGAAMMAARALPTRRAMPLPSRTLTALFSLILLAGCAPPRPAADVTAPPASRPAVVDISQWPAAPRFSFDATRAPLVVFGRGSLEVLDGCTLRGVQATRALAAPVVEPRVIRAQEELDAALPLRDPALAVGAGLPIAVMSVPVEERRLVVLDDNTRPVEGPCARATHVVTTVVRGGSAWRKHEIADRV